MGCDGGTIPKRDEQVRTKKNKVEGPKEVKLAAKWNYCHLSNQVLQAPIVADQLGNLYNKENFIEYLLDKTKYESGPEHVKSLKDVRELCLVANPTYKDDVKADTKDEFGDMNRSKWICPITGLEMNGMFKFFYSFVCGCVLSERAIKSVQSATHKCLKCDRALNDYDLIEINPSGEEDMAKNEQKLKARKENKKSKNSAKETTSQASTSTSSSNAIASSSTAEHKKPINKDSKLPVTTPAPPPPPSKRSIDKESDKNSKKTKSIQDDPNASDVYKSLFTTSHRAKNQQKAHWVTFNPQYF